MANTDNFYAVTSASGKDERQPNQAAALRLFQTHVARGDWCEVCEVWVVESLPNFGSRIKIAYFPGL